LLLNWQPRCDLGHLRVVVGKNLQLQLASCFDGKAGMILSKARRLRFAAAIDAEQDHRCRI
jgi:hypothetical protein